MGYNTKFDGELAFVNLLTEEQEVELLAMFDEDCRENPEWGEPELDYIDLELNEDNTAIIWNGGEKTYDLEKKVNVVLREMRKRWSDFALSGYMAAQGDDVKDSWNLLIGKDGWAHKVDRLNTGVGGAAKQDEMTEERAHEILKDFMPLEFPNNIFFETYDSGEKVCGINGASLNLDELKALVWLMENKA